MKGYFLRIIGAAFVAYFISRTGACDYTINKSNLSDPWKQNLHSAVQKYQKNIEDLIK